MPSPLECRFQLALKALIEVNTRNIQGRLLAIGRADPHTLVVDLPPEGGVDGLGFSGGELLYLAVAACVSNDLFREAALQGIELTNIRVRVAGDFSGDPAVSAPVEYEVKLDGNTAPERLRALVEHVDRIAEIPNSLRAGTPVRLSRTRAPQQPPPAS